MGKLELYKLYGRGRGPGSFPAPARLVHHGGLTTCYELDEDDAVVGPRAGLLLERGTGGWKVGGGWKGGRRGGHLRLQVGQGYPGHPGLCRSLINGPTTAPTHARGPSRKLPFTDTFIMLLSGQFCLQF